MCPLFGPLWEIPIYKPYIVGIEMGCNPQESLENTINNINATGTRTLGVHPSWSLDSWDQRLQFPVLRVHSSREDISLALLFFGKAVTLRIRLYVLGKGLNRSNPIRSG